MKPLVSLLILAALAAGGALALPQGRGLAEAAPAVPSARLLAAPLVADHTRVHMDDIPAGSVLAARQRVVWIYGHTSHGSQLVTGAHFMGEHVSPPDYKFLSDWNVPAQENPSGLRMANDGDWGWDPGDFLSTARARIDAALAELQPGDIPVFMWSWCGQMSYDDDAAGQYLAGMAVLEAEYPGVLFVYMTGHTEEGSNAQIDANNNQIRTYVQAHNKILYDFNDIESYNPDGVKDADPDDGCKWCPAWCAAHPADCQGLPSKSDWCAHTHAFNCVVKARAFWWLSSQLAGPRILAHAAPRNGALRVAWQVVADEGAFTGWQVEVAPVGGVPQLSPVLPLDARSLLFDGLSNGQAYDVVVRAMDGGSVALQSDAVRTYATQEVRFSPLAKSR